MNVFISPTFRGTDNGDGGIRRVVEAQHKYLPDIGVTVVDTPEKADIIALHAGNWVDGFPDIPKVAHCHGLYWGEYEWAKWCYDLNKRVTATILHADAVSAPSTWVANAIKRNFWVDAAVLNHGVDLADWPVSDDPRRYVLWNKTRIDPVCNIDALDFLLEHAKDVDFVSTFGPENRPSNLKVTGRLPFESAKDYIKNAGVYLCTARETFGIGTLEAMASGVPILGWNWGGQTEIVQHKVNGWLARPGDYDGLLEGLRYCLENRFDLGKAAREHISQNYTWKQAIQRYAEFYAGILAHKQPVKVSVIITCYNLAHLLERAVQSVLDQDFDDYEIIIVDDQSPDNTTEIATALCNRSAKIRYVKNEKNLYLAGALNEGIRIAKGRYIVPLDADNMLGNNILRILSNALDSDGTLDIAYGAMSIIEDGRNEWKSSWPPQTPNVREQLIHHNQCPSTSMYRKKIWERVGGYRRRCRTAEDADFWCRALSFGAKASKVTDAISLRYYNRADSMSHVNGDWPWENWYPWSADFSITPPGAILRDRESQPAIPTYDPPVISVIIPVGPGHEEIWIDAVDSIVAQTFTKWEIILVNDSGNSLGWVHPFVKVVTTKGSEGVARARNLGIAESNASLFVLLDADDYLQQDALGSLHNTYKRFGGYVYSDWYVHETKEHKEVDEYLCENLVRSLPHAVTALYPKSAWIESNGFDEVLASWEDWDFILKIADLGYCGTRVPEPLLVYRMSSGQRREQLYADRENAKQEIYTKWEEVFSGRRKLMACGGCSRGGGGYIVKQNGKNGGAQAPVQGDSQEMMLLEFLGSGGARTYVGQKTRTTYRFGSDPDHRIRFVHKIDAEEMLLLKGVFREYVRERALV